MSESELREEHSVFGEEDNNPFPHTSGIASLMSSRRPENEENGANGETTGDTASRNSIGSNSEVSGPSNGTDSSLNASPNGDSHPRASDDVDESLLLYRGEREPYNTVYLNYENRVSKLLSPETNASIHISEAGKSNEGMTNSSKKYIVYTIKLINGDNAKEELQTRRRYSDFESLRDVLTKVFPLLIIPPIPPKNYFTLNVLNGLVGSNTSSSVSTNGNGSSAPESSNGSSGATYSYINSNHLNKNRLIEHRKRLLSNFLNNCLHIPQIRNLEFFAKFLDPSANWSDEIMLINSQLPKSVYQSNPENGLRTDPLYTDFPLPVSANPLGIPFFKNAKKITKTTNKLLGTGANTEPPTTEEDATNENGNGNGEVQNQVVRTSHLDYINKKIMDNFIGLSSDYVELGTILNTFSLLWADWQKVKIGKNIDPEIVKPDVIFDKIGVAYDRSYITINALIGELETKFSEPLGEAVQYSAILQSVKKFQERKLKQKDLLDTEVNEKKKELAELRKAELEATKMENALNNGVLRAGEGENASNTSKTPAKKRLFPNMSSFKKITKYVSDIMDQNPEITRKHRVTQLQTKISTLEQCQNIMLEDISYITDELDKNFKAFHQQEFKSIYQILLSYNGIMISWAKKNIEIWEEIKEEIETFGS